MSNFSFDVFLSHSSKNKMRVRSLAEKLREASIRVWFDEWIIQPGDDIYLAIEKGLEESRVQVLCLSPEALEAEWVGLERSTALFRNPSNSQRRFIPIILAQCDIPDALRRYKYINYQDETQAAFAQLLAAIRATTQVLEADLGSDSIIIAEKVRCIDQYEPKPQIFGRTEEIESTVQALLGGRHTVIAGGPGMGKTAISIAALYDQRLVERFGERRVFVPLEAASGPRAILSNMVNAFGMPSTGDEASLLRLLETRAATAPMAAILDNFETGRDVDRAEADRLLSLAGQINGLSLIVTIRGVAPPLPGANLIEDLPKLSSHASEAAFLAISGDVLLEDPYLADLLQILDGHVLSIRLVAAQAVGLPSLKGIKENWEDVHAEILRQPGEKETRFTSVRASLSLSTNNRRMTAIPLAKRILSLLAYLPGGLHEGNVRTLLSDHGTISRSKINEAIASLHQLRIVERRPDLRLRMLTPLRECAKLDIKPMKSDIGRLVDFYLKLAATGGNVGTLRRDELHGLEEEADNLDPICSLALATDLENKRLYLAINGLVKLYRIYGLGSVGTLERAISLSENSTLTADCLTNLAMVTSQLGETHKAKGYLSKAKAIFSALGNKLGEANCVFQAAELDTELYRHDAAWEGYQDALKFFRETGRTNGEGYCILGMGRIVLRRSEANSALAYFAKAISLFEKGDGHQVGIFNCMQNLSFAAYCRFDLDKAEALSRQTLELNKDIGTVRNVAIACDHLGRIAFAKADCGAAIKWLSESMNACRKIGAVHGEAIALVHLGTVMLANGNLKEALSLFAKGHTLVQKRGYSGTEANLVIRRGQALMAGGDPKGSEDIEKGFSLFFSGADRADRALPGWHALHSSLVSNSVVAADKGRERARTAWRDAGRLDLVFEWLDAVPNMASYS